MSLSVANVEAAVRRIEKAASVEHDDEQAHTDEDALWAKVLAAVASGAPDSPALAAAALRTQDIEFSRWCA